MKRVLPIVILFTFIKITVLVLLGIYLFKVRYELGGKSIADTCNIIWPIMYLLCAIPSVLFLPLKFIALDDMYYPYATRGERFANNGEYIPFTLVELKAPIYNYIDAFIFDPFISKWKTFWGY